MSETNNANDMQSMTTRSERLVNALAGAIMATVETAAERIDLASKVAQVNQRMQAFTSVLECIAAQKEPVLQRLASLGNSPSDRVMRAMLTRTVEVLTAQELAVLEGAGAPKAAAQMAIEHIDTPAAAEEPELPVPEGDMVRVAEHLRRKRGSANPSTNGTAH